MRGMASKKMQSIQNISEDQCAWDMEHLLKSLWRARRRIMATIPERKRTMRRGQGAGYHNEAGFREWIQSGTQCPKGGVMPPPHH